MATEGYAGIVDNTLVYRAGNQCVKGALLAAFDSVVEAVEAAVLDRFALSQSEVADFIHNEKPDFLEFEKWILGRLDSRTVGHTVVELNRRVADSSRELLAVEMAGWRTAHAALQAKGSIKSFPDRMNP